MKYALLFAKDLVPDGTRFDVFNCLNIMQNRDFIQDLKFGIGDGILNYYMYNYLLGNELGQVHVSNQNLTFCYGVINLPSFYLF